MVDLSSLLSKEVEKTERPKPLPVGTYEMLIGTHKFGESEKKKTPFVEFALSFVSPGVGVDLDALKEVEIQKPLSERTEQQRFYMTDGAMYRLKEFLEELGLEIGSGRTYQDVIPETRGQLVDVYYKHSFADSGNAYAEIDSFKAPVSE